MPYRMEEAKAESCISNTDISDEYVADWHNLIFLPFNNKWNLIIHLSIIISTSCNTFDIIFERQIDHKDYIYDCIYYICEVLFLLDTILTIMHRNMTKYRIQRDHEPKPICFLVTDVITLIPIYETYSLLLSISRRKYNNYSIRHIGRTKGTIRLYRIFAYFYVVSNQVGINQAYILTLAQLFRVYIITLILSALWYYISCWECNDGYDWTDHLPHHRFDPQSTIDWFLLSYVSMGSYLMCNYRGAIHAVTVFERAIVICTMLVGFMLHGMYYLGCLTEALQKKYLRQYEFERKLCLIMDILVDWDLSEEVKERTLQYYVMLWERRNGIATMPESFQLLPQPLQKEVALDLFFEALRHSHIFRDKPVAFKRALSLKMKCEFYLPGDYVFQIKQLKSKMVYIVSGVIQILTEEDEESPIMSFSNGSLLSEISVLLPLESNANVRCATYCEVQTLSFVDLYETVLLFREEIFTIRYVLRLRLERAAYLKGIKVRKTYSHSELSTQMKELHTDSTIQWIKHRWRHLAHLQTQKKLMPDVILSKYVEMAHTSRNLDMLVLSDDFELKTKAICMSSKCPFILEPSSSFRKFCGYVVLVVIAIQSIFIPYLVFVVGRKEKRFSSLIMVLDVINFVDIYLQVSTAVMAQNILITKLTDIAMYKVKKIDFLVDIITTLPLEMLAAFSGSSEHVVVLMMLNRVFKFYRIMSFVFEMERQLLINYIIIRVLKYVVLSVIISYWTCCILYYVSCPYKKCDKYGLLYYNAELETSDGNLYEESITTAFVVLFYYVVSMFSRTNFSSYFEFTPSQMIPAYLIIIGGGFLTIFFTAELTTAFYVRCRHKSNYNLYIRAINRYLTVNKVDEQLKKRVSEVIQFHWYYNENTTIVGKKGILTDSPKYLSEMIISNRVTECLSNVPLFKGCTRSFLKLVASKMIFKVLPPGALVTAADNRARWIHCIVRGYCTQTSIMPGDRERNRATILKPGDAFPVIEMLHEVLVLTNVETLTAVEVLSLPYNQLEEIFQSNSDFESSIKSVLGPHMKQFEKSLLRKKGRLPELTPPRKSKGRGDYFKYKLMDEEKINLQKQMYNRPFEVLGKWRYVKFIFMKTTIDPTHRYYKYYEISRFVINAFVTFVAITYCNIFAEIPYVTNPFIYIHMCLAIIDFYIRMHCQYYTTWGILVTHPLSTTRHYLTTSFVVDLWCILPISLIDDLFGDYNTIYTYVYLSMMTKPFALHRLLSYLNYCQSDITSRRANLIQSLKFCIVLAAGLGIIATLLQLQTCDVESVGKSIRVLCKGNNSWFPASPVSTYILPYQIFISCFYVATTVFTSTSVGEITLLTSGEIYFFLGIMLVLFVGKMFFFTKLLGSKIGGNVNLTIFLERVRSFEKFINKELVDENLAATTIEHYQYKWKRDCGNEISQNLSDFHPQLHEDITFALFSKTLKAVEMFKGADNSFFRLMGVQLKEVYFKMDADVIRCNDVQSLIYFVHKGKVDVIIAKSKVCTMGQGGMFGCLSNVGRMRQTIFVKAKVHVVLLAIESIQFHKTISKYNKIYNAVQQANFYNLEFDDNKLEKANEDEPSHGGSTTYTSCSSYYQLGKFTRYFLIKINPDGSFYRAYNYIMCVHVATFSVLFYFFVIYMVSFYAKGPFYAHVLTAILDLFFLTKIYVEFHLAYKDPESGVKIKNLRMIARRYMTKIGKFAFDILTCIPFEYLLMATVSSTYVKLGWMNRVLRLKYLYDYYNERARELNIRTHLRITYPIYMIFVMVQAMVAFWGLIACEGSDKCRYKSDPGLYNRLILTTKTDTEDIMVMYGFVVTLLTSTGLRDVVPDSIDQLLICIVMAFLFLAASILLCSSFTTIALIAKYTMRTYDCAIEDFKIYISGRQLSPFIFHKVWKYYLQLWKRQSGEWMPALINEAPPYLKQDLMYSLYGSYIDTHLLFSKTHVDFIRQIVTHLKRCVFFPGNFIVEKGDIDSSMYFIHAGEVDMVDEIGPNEIPHERLRRGSAFGIEPGLLRRPHRYYYLAHTVVDALMLTLDDWEYLLQWFPASKQLIWDGAAEMGFLTESKKKSGKKSKASWA